MDEASCGAFDAACSKAVANGALNLVADLSALTYISSAGIGSFVKAAKMVRQAHGEMVLTGLYGLVKDVFELTHVVTIFQVFESPELALAGVP